MTEYEKLALELKKNITEKDKEKIYDVQSFVFTELEIFLTDMFNKHQQLFLEFAKRECECNADGFLLQKAHFLMFKEIKQAVLKGVIDIVFEETYDYAYLEGYLKAISNMEGKND